MIKKIGIVLCFTFVLFAANYREASPVHPGDFPIESVPQFVIIGADDCSEAETILWLVDFLGKLKNPDGSPVLMNFYVNGRYAQDNYSGAADTSVKKVWQAWKKAIDAGHEIGNHTYSHWFNSDFEEPREDPRLLSVERWNAEIISNDLTITANLGISRSKIYGFRSPFLEYNRATFEATTRRGFLYDCSIEEGMQPDQNGMNRYWPYQITNGAEIDSLQAEWSTGEDDWGYKAIGKFPNSRMWEIPVYSYIVPHDSLSEKYGFKKGLRTRVIKNTPWFDSATGNLTGFDYNMYAPKPWEGASMKANECLATLKNTFDTHYKGNRAPMTLGMHPDYYMKNRDSDYKSAGNYLQRRKIIEEFLLYVIKNQDVRIITGHSLIAWMRNPIPLSDTPVLDEKGEPVRNHVNKRPVGRKPMRDVGEQNSENSESEQQSAEPTTEKSE
ncbi:MAG: polysaccharide deacetylase family protein [Chitinispirillales bacterium]|jgi:peptidoglycan/xylan/chitin deacetylase (PgdA/CDA1 family)|nr:polysaccharide deacetylase family protein [Chitinispirillales bacterium]